MNIQSINPATEQVNREFEAISGSEAVKEAKAVAKEVRRAFRKWRRIKVKERASFLRKLANVLRKNKQSYARLITTEMGKPVAEAESEIEKCVLICEYYADNSENFLKPEIVQTDATKSYIAFEPLGTILAIMPWNYPFSQAFRCAVPALAAGNCVILRHSNIVPQCALAIEQCFVEAGFPESTFRSIITDHATVHALIRSRYVNAVSLTGSVEAGIDIAKTAGKYLKKCVLELGGSDPFIVLSDADMQKACEAAAKGRLHNTGQSCIAAKRFIVVENRLQEFEQLFAENMRKYKVGDPMDPATQVGPLVREEQRQGLEEQVADALSKGAKLLLGGRRMEGNGFFYEPTAITNVKRGMRLFNEEVFGPVAAIIPAKTDRNSVSISNKTDYGLGASIWTSDVKKGEKLAKRIEAGVVFVNGTPRSDPRMPFGGIKKSGYGRELSRYGLLEFVNIKSVKVFGEPKKETSQKKAVKIPV
ncbi:MAG: NAD-dependent succinate-semialdehyde dehydrogenase [Candidatus Aenigmarchaeota archaeon]|nr:NAD-dependent succinate-semialdehyde dehydrogenase [Candidatus Aenigmarchaeota archaeon]